VATRWPCSFGAFCNQSCLGLLLHLLNLLPQELTLELPSCCSSLLRVFLPPTHLKALGSFCSHQQLCDDQDEVCALFIGTMEADAGQQTFHF